MIKSKINDCHTGLYEKVASQFFAIENWFREEFQAITPNIFASVDIRNSGSKIAPVDTNLFPGGFNNIELQQLFHYSGVVQKHISSHYPKVKTIGLVPENHTRNQIYWKNIYHLMSFIEAAGYKVYVTPLEDKILDLDTGYELIERDKGKLQRTPSGFGVGGVPLDVLILNLDLSEGLPQEFANMESKILPHPSLGWHRRKKSQHFGFYNKKITKLAELIDIDPWHFQTDFEQLEGVDLSVGKSLTKQNLKKVEELFSRIQQKYQEQNTTNKPYCVVKADRGTYGRGVIAISSPEELLHLSRSQRKKMKLGKGNQPIEEVIIQEGVSTIEEYVPDDEGVNLLSIAKGSAEPVIYVCDNVPIGAFYRVHPEKNEAGILNAPGMKFFPIPVKIPCSLPDLNDLHSDCSRNRIYTYGVIARVAALASSEEISS